MIEPEKIYLVGNPNSGKTTIFNSLTGQDKQTGNYSGVTVSTSSAKIQNTNFTLIDLPGTYSLKARSKDEQIAIDQITSIKDKDLILYIADAHQLKLHLLLFRQLQNLQKRICLVVNHIKGVHATSIEINTLSKQLDCQVFEFIQSNSTDFVQKALTTQLSRKRTESTFESYKIINNILEASNYQTEQSSTFIQQLNYYTTHPIFGLLIFCTLLLAVFQILFSFADVPISIIESSFEFISEQIKPLFNDHWIGSIVCDAILASLAAVVVFVPQIALLFLFIELLNQSGYLPRASFLTDGILRKFGLSGAVSIPIISSFACTVPAIMATRTIESKKKRLIATLVLPFITCAARLPVYVLIISLVIPSGVLMGLSYKSIVMFSLYALGVLITLLSALILSKLLPKETHPTSQIKQIPAYQIPKIKEVLWVVYVRLKAFFTDAGKYIFFASIILWFLANNSNSNYFYDQNPITIQESYLGQMGKAIEPVIRPLGYDYKIGIAIISSFAAREVFVGTLATIHNLDEENEQGLLTSMQQDVFSDGSKVYSLATGVSLLLFYAFSLQCISTIAVVKKETGSWLYTSAQFVLMCLVGYLAAFATYQILS